jgi:glucuronoarabinoxylan endo-1,4-beta-xylanase
MRQKTGRRLSIVAMGFAAMPLFAHSRAASAADATVDLSATQQLIRGFGASSAWCGTIDASIMDSLFTDLGYSILRVRIEENIGDGWSSGNYSAWAPELANAKNAIARGAIVFASPWNPPASMKSGGKLMTSKYGDYADYLKAYAKFFADNGAPLYAISLQNEPDFANDWTAWTATDLLNFLKEQGATLSSAIKVMMPESFQFIHAMSDPSLNDATVASYISIIGGHLYGARIQDYPLARDLDKEIWQTEHYFDDDEMSNIMNMAKEIHDCMVTGRMNAYVYWWITWDNGLCTSSGTLFKRAYVLGQFAKYIRPGYSRVDATDSPATDVNVSAYSGDDKVVIVAVNTGNGSVNQNFVLRGGTPSEISSWQTSASSNMAAGPSYEASSGSFTAALPAQSITTFVGSLGTTNGSGGGSGGASGAGGRASGGSTEAGSAGMGGGSDGVAGNAGASAGSGRSGVGGRSGSGGVSGDGGTVIETGGSPSSGGRGGSGASGGANGGSGGSTTANAGGNATGGSSVSAVTGGSGGSSVSAVTGGSGGSADVGTTTTSDDTPSGCGCVLRGRDAGRLGGGVGALLALCGLAFARRRTSARWHCSVP